ncbi:hypothetical protein D3C76_425340 [compost metagenome]
MDVRVRALIVDEGAEALELFRVFKGIGPFALVAVDHQLHLRLELLTQPEAVVDDHVLEVVEAAFQALAPDRGTLQLVGGADVEHQEAVDVTNQGRVIEVGGKQLGVARAHAAVTGHVEVPAFLGGDYAHVLALRLGAFTGASGDGELELVRRAQALVAVFDGQGHLYAVLYAITAPGTADTGLHRPGRFAIGVPGLKTRFNQLGPDVRQLMQLSAEQVDALAAGDLGVEVVFLRHHANRDQFVGGDLAPGDARHHRIGAVFLHVGHEGVVGVLQRHQRRVHDRLVPARGEDRAHRRFADVATGVATAMFGQQFFEGDHSLYPYQRIKLLTGIGEVFAQALVDTDAAGNQLMLEHLLEQAGATAAAGASLGLRLELAQVRTAAVDGRTNGALGDVMT